MKQQFIKPTKALWLFALPAMMMLGTTVQAQVKVGDNPGTINAGSALEIESTNKGVLLPRLALTSTTTWGLAGVAAAGMQVYNTAAGITEGSASYPIITGGIGIYYWDGTGWVATKGTAAVGGTEPWFNVATGTGATANTQDIYQMGNVGVGTATPGYKLHVAGQSIGVVNTGAAAFTVLSSGPTSNVRLQNNNGGGFVGTMEANDFQIVTTGTARIGVTPGGNVGIGTTAPTVKLQVEGSEYLNASSAAAVTKNALDINIGADGFAYGNRTDNFGINFQTNSSIQTGSVSRINTGDESTVTANGNRYLSFSVGKPLNELMYLTSANAGRVGIGNTAPTAKLEVTSGTANVSGVKLTNLLSTSPTTAGTAIGVDASGNVVTVASASSGPSAAVINLQAGAYTLQASDLGKIIIINSASAVNLTVPSTLGAGFFCEVIQKGLGGVDVVGSGVTFTSAVGLGTRARYSAIGIIMETTTAGYITGDGL